METYVAYALIEIHTGKVYFGSSGQIEQRLRRHVRDIRNKAHHNSPFQKLWNEGGQFLTEVFEVSSMAEARSLEQALIDWFITNEPDLTLNVGLSVSGGDTLTRNPNRVAVIEQMTHSVNDRYQSMTADERKAKYGRPGELNGMFGQTHTAEVKTQLSERHKGNLYASGYKWTDDQRQTLSERAKTRTGELNPFFGKTHSEETRQRISERKKELGLKPTNARRIMAEGREFESLTEAGRHLGVSPALMIHRIKSTKEKYASYYYID